MQQLILHFILFLSKKLQDSSIKKKKKKIKKPRPTKKDLDLEEPETRRSKKHAEKEKTAELSIEPLTHKVGLHSKACDFNSVNFPNLLHCSCWWTA